MRGGDVVAEGDAIEHVVRRHVAEAQDAPGHKELLQRLRATAAPLLTETSLQAGTAQGMNLPCMAETPQTSRQGSDCGCGTRRDESIRTSHRVQNGNGSAVQLQGAGGGTWVSHVKSMTAGAAALSAASAAASSSAIVS